MANVTLRPTSATGSNWSNIAYIYDGNTSNGATVTATSSNYSSRVATCNFNTSVIPTGATIKSATLSIMYKQGSTQSNRRYTPYIDINGSSNNRVISTQLTSTSTVTSTADITSYMSNLSTVTITPYTTNTSTSTSSSYQLTVYELWIDVEYTSDGEGSLELRPSSATASSWSNIANAYDGSITSTATVTISRSNYSSRTATFNFSTPNVPSGATIVGATLNVRVKASANSRITMYVDLNGSSSDRVINQSLTTTATNYSADITNSLNSLSSVKITGYMTSSTSTTFTLYEVWVDVSYLEPTLTKTQLINIGSNVVTSAYIGNTSITRIYLGDTLIFEQ